MTRGARAGDKVKIRLVLRLRGIDFGERRERDTRSCALMTFMS
jgi:hypothetical protein